MVDKRGTLLDLQLRDRGLHVEELAGVVLKEVNQDELHGNLPSVER